MSNQGNESFMKQLAANEKRVRDKAVESLRSYLRHRTSISELELLKLWKGLYYCMWMSDKPRNQQQLARDLASLVDDLPKEVVVPFLDAFWKTMSREWGGIDVLRMDKFLYLVRQYLNASFSFFAKSGWKDTKRLDEYMTVLSTTPLNPTEKRIPNGIRFHVIDIYVDELEKVDEETEAEMPVETLLEPLRAVVRDSPTKIVRNKVKEALEDDRVKAWLGEETTEAEGKEEANDEWGGIDE
ncbi:hypothetical protein BLS_005843 [Venturia inaequalis]|uniref:Uncharacterized protein n=1 Tax=Venturia inaequalis TaxID=5025 RepID=A0A8H3UDE2_VENIN|nr:hypothetical protein BLS_005843 [Venturia inaequalis]KAE9989233.1 hypothetical protein EG327_002935 [Venturia inaequalis]RDI85613.1 hypothetical protein Vi05172_g4287 [Venturia inaequalis]